MLCLQIIGTFYEMEEGLGGGEGEDDGPDDDPDHPEEPDKETDPAPPPDHDPDDDDDDDARIRLFWMRRSQGRKGQGEVMWTQ